MLEKFINLEIQTLRSPLIIGVLSTLFFALSLILFLSLFLRFTSLPENNLEIYASLVLIVSVFVGGMIAARQAEARFILHGIGVGVILICIIVVNNYFAAHVFSWASLIKKISFCILAGLFGGMIGAIIK